MEIKTYLESRVEDQINWYDRRSKTNKRWFYWLHVFEIIAAAAVPFLAGYMKNSPTCIPVIVGLLGVLIAIITATMGLFRFHEKWIEYRTVCESLKHEKNLFLTNTEPYIDEKTAFNVFVQRIEALISQENSKWSQYIKPTIKEKPTDK